MSHFSPEHAEQIFYSLRKDTDADLRALTKLLAMGPVPDADLLPGPEPTVGGPAWTSEFGRHIPGADGLLRREVMGNRVEKLIRHLSAGYGESLRL